MLCILFSPSPSLSCCVYAFFGWISLCALCAWVCFCFRKTGLALIQSVANDIHPLTRSLDFFHRMKREKNRCWIKIFFFLLLFIIIVCLFLSLSRSFLIQWQWHWTMNDCVWNYFLLLLSFLYILTIYSTSGISYFIALACRAICVTRHCVARDTPVSLFLLQI